MLVAAGVVYERGDLDMKSMPNRSVVAAAVAQAKVASCKSGPTELTARRPGVG